MNTATKAVDFTLLRKSIDFETVPGLGPEVKVARYFCWQFTNQSMWKFYKQVAPCSAFCCMTSKHLPVQG